MGKVKVFKSLHRTSGVIFANKLYTLEMLNEYRDILPHSFVIPDALVTVEKQIKGFVLPLIKGINLELYLADSNVKISDKIMYLKKIGDILKQLDHLRKASVLDSIYLNDLHASNFIVDEKNQELRVVDLDSCRICESKPLLARFLTPISLLSLAPGHNKYDIYRKEILDKDGNLILDITDDDYEYGYCKYKNYHDELGFINSNADSDLYCYAIVFLNFLYGDNVNVMGLEHFYDYMDYLEKIGLNRKLTNAIRKIVINAPNENIGPYLNKITDEQVELANHKVYELTRNK